MRNESLRPIRTVIVDGKPQHERQNLDGTWPTSLPTATEDEVARAFATASPTLADAVRAGLEAAAEVAWNHEPNYDGPIETAIRALAADPEKVAGIVAGMTKGG